MVKDVLASGPKKLSVKNNMEFQNTGPKAVAANMFPWKNDQKKPMGTLYLSLIPNHVNHTVLAWWISRYIAI
jgi:hypothetical protein